MPYNFPDPNNAHESGIVAIGGDLSEQRLLNAYQSGIFPWYSEGEPIMWFSPDPRLVLKPEKFKISKSFQKTLRNTSLHTKVDTNFEAVIRTCAELERPGQDGTWITEDMICAYIKLHHSGYAHSFETYKDKELVGGLYGISLGHMFFGESMFHIEKDASKLALNSLVQKCLEWNFDWIDSQVPTDHMIRMGAEEIDRVDFLKELSLSLKKDTRRGSWS